MKILYFAPSPTALPNARVLKERMGATGLYSGLSLIDARMHYAMETWDDLIAYGRHYQNEFSAILVCVPQRSSESWRDFISGMRQYSMRDTARPVIAMYAPPPGEHKCSELYDMMAAGAVYAYDQRTDVRLLAEYMARAATTPPKGIVKPYSVGPLTLNFHTGDVTLHDQPVHLTLKEFELLSVLARRPGMVLTKDAIMTDMYQMQTDEEPDLKIVDVMICKLRNKLTSPQIGNLGERLIRTVWGRGYRMAGNEADLAQPLEKNSKFLDAQQGTPLVIGNASFIKGAKTGQLWFSDQSKRLSGVESRLLLLTQQVEKVPMRASQHWTYLDSGVSDVSGLEGQSEAAANRAVERAVRSLNRHLSVREDYQSVQIGTMQVGSSLYFWRGLETPESLARLQARASNDASFDKTAPRSNLA